MTFLAGFLFGAVFVCVLTAAVGALLLWLAWRKGPPDGTLTITHHAMDALPGLALRPAHPDIQRRAPEDFVRLAQLRS